MRIIIQVPSKHRRPKLVPVSPAVVPEAHLRIVAAHLNLPGHELINSTDSEAAAELFVLLYSCDVYGNASCHINVHLGGKGGCARRDAVIEALKLHQARRKIRYCVLLQQPYLNVLRHMTRLTLGLDRTDEDDVPLALLPKLREDRNGSCRILPCQLGTRDGHRPLRMLWLGDSIISDLRSTGALSWAHACSIHECTNLGLPGENLESLIDRITAGMGTAPMSRAENAAICSAFDAANQLSGPEDSASNDATGMHAPDTADPVVVVHSGNNNLEYDTPCSIVGKVYDVILALRQRLPNGRIILLGYFAGRAIKPRRQKCVEEINDRLAELHTRFPEAALPAGAAGRSVRSWFTYVDLAAALACRGHAAPDCQVPEEVMSDNVHLNAIGCHALLNTVLGVVARL